MVPKEDERGIMVSALQSREFGFGFRKVTRDELARVNASRIEKEYKDTAAAIKIKGTAMKIRSLREKTPSYSFLSIVQTMKDIGLTNVSLFDWKTAWIF